MFEINDIVLYNRTEVCRVQEKREMLTGGSRRVPWIDSALIRKKEYMDLLNRGNPVELIGLIRTLHDRREAVLRSGHKFSEADEKYLAAAEKKLYPLFKHILNVECEDFLPMITDTTSA